MMQMSVQIKMLIPLGGLSAASLMLAILGAAQVALCFLKAKYRISQSCISGKVDLEVLF